MIDVHGAPGYIRSDNGKLCKPGIPVAVIDVVSIRCLIGYGKQRFYPLLQQRLTGVVLLLHTDPG